MHTSATQAAAIAGIAAFFLASIASAQAPAQPPGGAHSLHSVPAPAPAGGPWIKLAPFPQPAEEVLGATAGGKLYVFAGLAPGWKPIGLVFEYDPAANTWTQKKPMPVASHHVSFASHNDKIYAFGGFRLPESGPAGLGADQRGVGVRSRDRRLEGAGADADEARRRWRGRGQRQDLCHRRRRRRAGLERDRHPPGARPPGVVAESRNTTRPPIAGAPAPRCRPRAITTSSPRPITRSTRSAGASAPPSSPAPATPTWWRNTTPRPIAGAR